MISFALSRETDVHEIVIWLLLLPLIAGLQVPVLRAVDVELEAVSDVGPVCARAAPGPTRRHIARTATTLSLTAFARL